MGKGSERESGKSAPKGGNEGGEGESDSSISRYGGSYANTRPMPGPVCSISFQVRRSWASMTDEGGLDILPTETVIYIDAPRAGGRTGATSSAEVYRQKASCRAPGRRRGGQSIEERHFGKSTFPRSPSFNHMFQRRATSRFLCIASKFPYRLKVPLLGRRKNGNLNGSI